MGGERKGWKGKRRDEKHWDDDIKPDKNPPFVLNTLFVYSSRGLTGSNCALTPHRYFLVLPLSHTRTHTD